MIKKINRRLTKYIIEKYPNWDASIALRYLTIIASIKRNFPAGIKILDVGSGEFGLATYIGDGYEITGTDIDFGEERQRGFRIVKASAEKLPFREGEFDVVVSVDMMEHLPQSIREKAVFEMVRVAKSKIYISCPRGRFSKMIDRLLSKYYIFTHKTELEYLNEHEKHGLPSENSIERYIKNALKRYKRTSKVIKRGNTNVILWFVLLLLGFSEVKIFTSLYHKLLLILPILNLMHFWPTYRVEFEVNIKNNV